MSVASRTSFFLVQEKNSGFLTQKETRSAGYGHSGFLTQKEIHMATVLEIEGQIQKSAGKKQNSIRAKMLF
jgi:hypothetical protein